MPEVGDVLAEKYRLERLLGEGGMGAVFEARHARIGKRLAVKLLRPELADRSDVVDRFAREAEAAAAIKHPAIIDIHDIGTASDGSIFLVMEYLEGQSLGEVLDQQKILDPNIAAYIACQVLSALDAAHNAGIVHRDLKPDNVFLVDTGQALPEIKLLDFGISKVIDRNNPDSRLTQTGAVMGTPFYMAPEQAKGRKDLDHRVDIYAMGVILYECVTGRRPFEGDNMLALIQEVVNTRPMEPTATRPDLSPELEQIILYAMVKEPSGRFQTAAQMLEVLLPFVDEQAAAQLKVGQSSGVLRRGPDSVSGLGQSRPGLVDSKPGLLPTTPAAGTDMAWQAGAQSAAPKSGKMGLVIGLVVVGLVLLVGLGGAALFLGTDMFGTTAAPAPPVPVPPPSLPLAAPDSGASAAAEPPSAQSVTVSLQGIPDGARVFMDDLPVEGTTIQRPQSADPHMVRVEHAGHEPWRQVVNFQQDRAVAVALQPLPGAGEADAGAAPPPATTGRTGRVARPQRPRPTPPPPPSRPRPGRNPGDRFGSTFE